MPFLVTKPRLLTWSEVVGPGRVSSVLSHLRVLSLLCRRQRGSEVKKPKGWLASLLAARKQTEFPRPLLSGFISLMPIVEGFLGATLLKFRLSIIQPI